MCIISIIAMSALLLHAMDSPIHPPRPEGEGGARQAHGQAGHGGAVPLGPARRGRKGEKTRSPERGVIPCGGEVLHICLKMSRTKRPM